MALEGNVCSVQLSPELAERNAKIRQSLLDMVNAVELLAKTMRDFGDISRRHMERIDFVNASMRKIKDRSRWHAKGPMRTRSMERVLRVSQRWRIHE